MLCRALKGLEKKTNVVRLRSNRYEHDHQTIMKLVESFRKSSIMLTVTREFLILDQNQNSFYFK